MTAALMPIETENDTDAAEWARLEAEHAEMWHGWHYQKPVDTGCGKVGKPHPQSYRPDLPLRGLGLGPDKLTHKWTLTAADRKREFMPAPPKYNPNAPHPASYRPDLPLRSMLKTTKHWQDGKAPHFNGIGWTPGDRVTRYTWPISKAEKEQLSKRPLTFTKPRD